MSPKSTAPLALVGGTLIDVTGKPATPNAVVLIEGDRIVAAGPREPDRHNQQHSKDQVCGGAGTTV